MKLFIFSSKDLQLVPKLRLTDSNVYNEIHELISC